MEALAVVRVDEEDDGVDLREVILPHAARDLVTAQIKGAELDLRDRELLGRRVLRRVVLRQLLVLEHVQQRGFAGIVQAQEENLGVFVRQAEIVERRPHPVEEEHGGKRPSGRLLLCTRPRPAPRRQRTFDAAASEDFHPQNAPLAGE